MAWTEYPGLRKEYGSPARTYGPPNTLGYALDLVLPRSHRRGVFPRMYIASGEQLVFETKPSVFAFVNPINIGLGSIFLGIYIYLLDNFGLISGVGPFALEIIVLVLVVAFVGGITGGLVRWWVTSYAATDRRVLRSRGIVSRDAIDCAFDKIQNASLDQGIMGRVWGFGNVSFQTAGIRGLFGSAASNVERAGGVYWAGVIDPVGTRRFVEELKERVLRTSKAQELADMAHALSTTQQVRVSVDREPVPAPPPQSGAGKPSAGPLLFCPRCGIRQVASAQFCHSCGNQLPDLA